MKKAYWLSSVMGLVLLTGCSAQAAANEPTNTTATATKTPSTLSQPPSYWPTEDWKTCLPEQEGMSAQPLDQMFQDIKDKNLPVDGLLITRNGYIVAENYYNGNNETSTHLIHSVTKSITSALVGIAISEGKIHSVNDHVLDYFKDKQIKNMDSLKKNITIKQCLTMSTGLDWHEMNKDGSNNDDWMNKTFYDSSDPLMAVLNRKINKNEVNKFNYSTGLPEILSAILQKQNDNTLESDYADEKLLQPMGITNYDWPTNIEGVSYGGTAMSMTPRDMAKFGYLYLHHGNWDGKQLVPEKWVEASTKSYLPTNFKDVGYGYYWWVFKENGHPTFEALGADGQYITVIPDLNLVVVLTSSDGQDVGSLLRNYILPAVQSSTAIPEDAAADKQLKALTSEKNWG